MKKYLYSTAYFVIAGLLLATLIIVIPLQIIGFVQGQNSFINVIQNIVIIPFVAMSAGTVLAGIPVVITGFFMSYLNRYSMPIFLIGTILLAVVLEFTYCKLIDIRPDYIPAILATSIITTCCLCLGWRLWLDLRIND